MRTNEIEVKTKNFLAKYVRINQLENDCDLFVSGLVNSLFAMQLVLFVEREWGFTVENEDLDIDNFRSINAIVKLVLRKTKVVELT